MFSKSPLTKLQMMMPNTLSSRLTLWYAGSFALAMLLALLLSYFALGALLEQKIEDDLSDDVAEFSMFYASGGLPAVIREIEIEVSGGTHADEFFRILDQQGAEIYSSDLAHWQGLVVDQRVLGRIRSNPQHIGVTTVELDAREYASKIVYGAISPQNIIQIGESVEETTDLLELTLMIFSVMLFVVIPVAGYIGWSISRQAVQGIKEVSNAALDIQSGMFDRQIDMPVRGEELQTLVSTFNAMAERIRKLISEMREMTDNIAHDLRSPITRIRVISETVLADKDNPGKVQAAVSETISECDRLITLINTTLDVAEAEADVLPHHAEPMQLSEMAAEMCELYQPLAEQKNITLSCQIEPGCQFQGRRQSMQRVFVNLIDNALKYTGEQGSITVSLRTEKNQVLIQVADSGIGISEQDQLHVFDRFYRCDDSRSQEGCGLGLSFVAAVVKAHGGQIKLDSTLGQGSTFTISFKA